MLKAIETRYKGYRFRSRLEARWAVFFDALGLRWEYEPQGFDFGPLGRYLPDFFLPEIDDGLWVEVKPDGAWETCGDRQKWEALSLESGQPFLLAEGTPSLKSYVMFCGEFDLVGDSTRWIDVCFASQYLPPVLHDVKPRLYFCPGGPEDADCDWAVEAARSARFEHGQMGA